MPVADISRLEESLKTVKSAIVLLPQSNSMDAVASGLALALSLQKKGVSTVVTSPSPMTVELNRLVGVNDVRADLGDKNLVISFANYPADGIERVAYNIENSQFALTVVPKAGNTAPRQNQINLGYSGIGADLIIIVGTNPEGLGKFAKTKEIMESPNLAVLNNAPLIGWSQVVELIDPSRASIAEVTADIIESLELPMDEDIATNLLFGLEAGTKNFTTDRVSADTFLQASQLLQNGAQRKLQVQPQMKQQRPLPGLPSDVLPQQFKDTTIS